MLNTMLNAQKDLDLTLAEQERYGGEKPLIDRIKEQEEELKEVRTSEHYYKNRFESAERRWVEESNMASRIHDDNMILNHRLVELQDELDKTKEETGWRGHCRVNEDEETS